MRLGMGIKSYEELVAALEDAKRLGLEPNGVVCRSKEEAAMLVDWIEQNMGHESEPGPGFPCCKYCKKPLSEWRGNEECLARNQ